MRLTLNGKTNSVATITPLTDYLLVLLLLALLVGPPILLAAFLTTLNLS